ncbi:MAG TPA: hypothetical protein VFB89_04620 [Gemmatimonadales bacterium]|nr:hypothetical protein [Gemmatimonadales bacterium]
MADRRRQKLDMAKAGQRSRAAGGRLLTHSIARNPRLVPLVNERTAAAHARAFDAVIAGAPRKPPGPQLVQICRCADCLAKVEEAKSNG